MLIWSACTKLLKRKDSKENSALQPLVDQGFVYDYEEIYLGKKGILFFPDRSIIFEWFYTERDGIFMQIKQGKPNKILFEYFDGASFLNDGREGICKSLTELKEDLEELRNELKSGGQINSFRRMEGIILSTIERTAF